MRCSLGPTITHILESQPDASVWNKLLKGHATNGYFTRKILREHSVVTLWTVRRRVEFLRRIVI